MLKKNANQFSRRRSTPTATSDVVANQVFLGVPWKGVRSKYEKAVDSLKSKFPLSFVIVGRSDRQDAQDLLAVIKERLQSSSYAIFDATTGNANVSLEFGYAEAHDIPRVLYLSTYGRTKKSTSDAPIIADLAGKRRHQYKQDAALLRLLHEFAKSHAYTVRFERFLADLGKNTGKGTKKRNRALALKVVHSLDGVRDSRRTDIVQQLQADPSRYTGKEVDTMLRKLHTAKLIRSQQGPYARVQIA